MIICLKRLAASSICFWFALSTSVLAQDTNDASANGLLKNAVTAELAGSAQERSSLLADVIEEDPDNRSARWHSGQVLIRSDEGKETWRTIEEAEKAASKDPLLAEYAAIRAAKSDDLEGHELLAEWCRRQGMDQRARVHWLRVLQLKPNHRKAIGRLGLRSYKGKWLTRDQIVAIKEREREVAKLKKKWNPTFSAWRKAYRSKDENEKRRIALDLKEVVSPKMIGLLETHLSPSNQDLALAVVEAIDSVTEQVATESLVRHATLSKWSAVRSSATRKLARRPLHGYVPILIDAMMAPYEFQSWNVRSSLDSGHVLAMNYAIGQKGKHVDRMLGGSVQFLGTGDDDSAEDVREEIMERVERINDATEDFNRPLAQVLRSTTGESYENDPSRWNDWWNDYNEYYVPEYKPVITSYRRPRTRVVATRPFSCFPAGTLVSTETATVPIEKIRVGDKVLAKNPFTGELRYQPVMQTTVRDSDAILEVFFNNERLLVTRGHPMWVNGRQWQMAKQLRRGDLLHGAQEPAAVEFIRQVRGSAKVYNLVVAEDHTYFVGKSRVLVHDNTIYTPPGNRAVPGDDPR